MPKFEFELGKIGPATIASALSLATTLFLGGMIWAQLTGEQAQLRRDVDRVHVEINLMRAYDTSIAVLKNDVGHMKNDVGQMRDAVRSIERMMKMGN